MERSPVEEFHERRRSVITNAKVLPNLTIYELLNALKLNVLTQDSIYHIFSILSIHPEYCRKCGKVTYQEIMGKYALNVPALRTNITAVGGPIHPIIVAKGDDKLWIVDGGTRIETIKATDKVNWMLIDVNPDASPLDAAIALSIALSTSFSKFTTADVIEIYSKFAAFFRNLGLTSLDVLGVSLEDKLKIPKTTFKLIDVINEAVIVVTNSMSEYPRSVTDTALLLLKGIRAYLNSNPKNRTAVRLSQQLPYGGYPPPVLLAKFAVATAGALNCFHVNIKDVKVSMLNTFRELAREAVKADVNLMRELTARTPAMGNAPKRDYSATAVACRERVREVTGKYTSINGAVNEAVNTFNALLSNPKSFSTSPTVLAATVTVEVLKRSGEKSFLINDVLNEFGVDGVTYRLARKRLGELMNVKAT